MNATYPENMKFRPIDVWPGYRPVDTTRSNFSASWSDTLALLNRELRHLGDGTGPAPSVLQLALKEREFRNDGLPYANARPSHPGIILSIDSRIGPLSYPAAQYDRWQDNLRAIALSLDGLRRLDRYGITPNNEQYAGWRQLPSAGQGTTVATVPDAERFLRTMAGSDLPDDAPLDKVHRAARRNTHPDRPDNDGKQWAAVEAAAEVLRAAGRIA